MCLVLGGCAVLGGAAAYGIYRLVTRRRGPDSLNVNAANDLTRALAVHAEIVSPEAADAIVTVQETGARRGVGLTGVGHQFIVTATDAVGRALLIGEGPLPSPRLVITAEALSRPETAQGLAARLAAVR